MRFIGEINDMDVFDAGVKSILDFGKDGLIPHCIYCGHYYAVNQKQRSRFRQIFLTKMKKYEIQFPILTQLHMSRRKLVTKETAKKAYKGELKTEKDWKLHEGCQNT